MIRECLLVAVAPLAGCSLVLDFSDSAIPIDAPPDSPYTDEQCGYLEPNNSLAEASVVTSTETGPAAICAEDVEDRDFYRFTVPAGITGGQKTTALGQLASLNIIAR